MAKSAPDTLDSVRKDIKRIRRAGRNAEYLGWLLLACAAGVVWIPGTKSQVLIRFGISILLGLLFTLTGKYVKDGMGRRTKWALLVNAIVSLPLCAFIIPILVCVQSAINYSRFKDLPESIRVLYSKPKRLRVHMWDIIILVVILVVGAASLVLRIHELNKPKVTVNAAAKASDPANEEAKYFFKINSPGELSATDLSQQISGQTVPYTVFQSIADKGAADYDVYAYVYPIPAFDYSKLTPAAMATAIHASLASSITGLQGTLVSSKPSMYLGRASEDAQFTSKTLSGTTPGYMRVFYIGNYEYVIYAKGATESQFNDFANSFQYEGE